MDFPRDTIIEQIDEQIKVAVKEGWLTTEQVENMDYKQKEEWINENWQLYLRPDNV